MRLMDTDCRYSVRKGSRKDPISSPPRNPLSVDHGNGLRHVSGTAEPDVSKADHLAYNRLMALLPPKAVCEVLLEYLVQEVCVTCHYINKI